MSIQLKKKVFKLVIDVSKSLKNDVFVINFCIFSMNIELKTVLIIMISHDTCLYTLQLTF